MSDVFFLTCGELDVPAWAIRPSGQRSGRCRMSITVAVAIRHGGDVVLVDCGFGRRECANPRKEIGRVWSSILGVKLNARDAIVEQLAALGLPPSSVKTIVATHLHLDHIGGAVDFPNADIVCSAREWKQFRRRPRRLGYRGDDITDPGRVVALELSGGPVRGFPDSRDLFGDGEVVLLDARGHTPGHLAVALQSQGATYVHIGDAADQVWEYNTTPGGPSLQARIINWKVPELRRTYACIRACESDPDHPVIVPAHDIEVLARLPRRPASAIDPSVA